MFITVIENGPTVDDDFCMECSWQRARLLSQSIFPLCSSSTRVGPVGEYRSTAAAWLWSGGKIQSHNMLMKLFKMSKKYTASTLHVR